MQSKQMPRAEMEKLGRELTRFAFGSNPNTYFQGSCGCKFCTNIRQLIIKARKAGWIK